MGRRRQRVLVRRSKDLRSHSDVGEPPAGPDISQLVVPRCFQQQAVRASTGAEHSIVPERQDPVAGYPEDLGQHAG